MNLVPSYKTKITKCTNPNKNCKVKKNYALVSVKKGASEGNILDENARQW